MPIEIKELHIKAIVGEKSKQPPKAPVTNEDITRLKKEITKELTEKIMRLLQQKNER